jgi:hypothetical protein
VKSRLLIAILSAACAAQTQTLRVVPVNLDGTVSIPKTIQFSCTQDYDRQACLKDSISLRHALAPYPLDQLGAWSFVLAPSGNWTNLVHSLGGDPISPAFSIIEQRTTVMERSLFSATPSRSKDLLLTFGVIGNALLDLAVTHELGHAICHDQDERRADDYGRALREKKPVACGKGPGIGAETEESKPKSGGQASDVRSDVGGFVGPTLSPGPESPTGSPELFRAAPRLPVSFD